MGLLGFFKKRSDIIVPAPEPKAQSANDIMMQDDGFGDASTMRIDDVFSVSGRGTIAVGRVESGSFQIGQHVLVVRDGAVIARTGIVGIELFHKTVDKATAGDNCGLLLHNVPRDAIAAGDYITTKGV